MNNNTNLLNPEETSAKDEDTNTQRPENVPVKFWDPKTNNIRVDAFLKSYAELEKKLSKNMMIDPENPDQNKIRELMGIPESADGYEVALQNDLLERDPQIEQLLHEHGFTTKQVQIVYDLAAQNLIPMIVDLAAEFQADRELERLTKHFGGKEQFDEISKQLTEFGKKTLSKDAFKGLASSYDGVLALYRMMQSDEPTTLKNNSHTSSSPTEQDLKSMMRDPKYWRDQDPSFIAKITDGFKRLYTTEQ